MESIITFYENKGFPFARVFLDSMQISGNRLNAVMKCNKGPEVKIDTILNRGNLEIEPQILYSILGIFPGELYSEVKLQNVSQQVPSRKFIQEKSPAVVNFTDSGAVITVNLDMRKVSSVDGIAGFMPDYLNEGRLFVTGDFNFSLVNALRLGENLKLQWRQPQRGTQDLKTGFALPWLIYIPFGLSWDFYLLKRDSSYVTTENKPVLFYARNNAFKTGFYVNYFRSRMISTASLSGQSELSASCDMNIISPGLRIEYAKISKKNPFNEGTSFIIDISAGKKTIQKNPNLNDTLYQNIQLNSVRYKLETDFSFHFHYQECYRRHAGSGTVSERAVFTWRITKTQGF